MAMTVPAPRASALWSQVEYQGRRARRPYNDRQDRSALQQPQRRTTSAVQRAFGRREIYGSPEGTWCDGLIIRPNGLLIRPNELIIRSDGLVIRPDNLIIRPDELLIRHTMSLRGFRRNQPRSSYYYYVIRTLGTTTDQIDIRTDRHTENKHKTTHYR